MTVCEPNPLNVCTKTLPHIIIEGMNNENVLQMGGCCRNFAGDGGVYDVAVGTRPPPSSEIKFFSH